MIIAKKQRARPPLTRAISITSEGATLGEGQGAVVAEGVDLGEITGEWLGESQDPRVFSLLEIGVDMTQSQGEYNDRIASPREVDVAVQVDNDSENDELLVWLDTYLPDEDIVISTMPTSFQREKASGYAEMQGIGPINLAAEKAVVRTSGVAAGSTVKILAWGRQDT